MDGSPTTHDTETDTTHGNEVGIWVCEGSGISISPYLFMQSVCSGRFPQYTPAKWDKASPAPKPFRKSETIPLIHGECGRILIGGSHLHLFSIEVPATRLFEQESDLQDWRIPVGIAGVVVIFDKKYDSLAYETWVRQLLSSIKPSAPSKNRTLEWVKAQELPFVVAATGYDTNPNSDRQFRHRYGLAPDIPVVFGFAFVEKPPKDKRSGMDIQATGTFQSLFSGKKLSFDAEYARQVLGVLCRLIEKKRHDPRQSAS